MNVVFLKTTQDLIRDELQSSFKQRAEQTIHRKQQELESQVFKRTMDAVQEVDIDSQRVSCSHAFPYGWRDLQPTAEA